MSWRSDLAFCQIVKFGNFICQIGSFNFHLFIGTPVVNSSATARRDQIYEVRAGVAKVSVIHLGRDTVNMCAKPSSGNSIQTGSTAGCL